MTCERTIYCTTLAGAALENYLLHTDARTVAIKISEALTPLSFTLVTAQASPLSEAFICYSLGVPSDCLNFDDQSDAKNVSEEFCALSYLVIFQTDSSLIRE